MFGTVAPGKDIIVTSVNLSARPGLLPFMLNVQLPGETVEPTVNPAVAVPSPVAADGVMFGIARLTGDAGVPGQVGVAVTVTGALKLLNDVMTTTVFTVEPAIAVMLPGATLIEKSAAAAGMTLMLALCCFCILPDCPVMIIG